MIQRKRWPLVLLIGYSALLAVVLFSPGSGAQSGMVTWLETLLRGMGAPRNWVTFSRLEIIMNAAIVAPVTVLGALILPRWSWRDWTACGFLVALLVELLQGLLLPAREASLRDVVANTAGALLGALLVSWCGLRTKTAREEPALQEIQERP